MGSLESESTLAYRMLGIGLLCLAVFVPPLYGMEAKDCGFDDRLLEVNKTERSGWDPDENKIFDWSEYEIGSTGVISVPYYYKSQPSKWVRSVVEAGLRYVEENMSCIKFKETKKDLNKKQVEMKIPSRGRCLWRNGEPGGAVGVDRFRREWDYGKGRYVPVGWNKRIYFSVTHAPCWQYNWNKDSIEPLSGWHNTFVHEIFHVFGIEHTMKRTDRDNYIKVSDHTSKDPQFKKDALIPMPGGGKIPYECNSIMHYRPRSGNFKAVNPSTCKFGSKNPTDNDWKAVRYNTCPKLKGSSR